MKMRINRAGIRVFGAVLGATSLGVAGAARADGLGPVKGAFGETKPIFDMRLRAENVDQDGILNDAHATTLRLRAGFETGKAWSTALLVEGEGVVPLQSDYRPDPMIPTMTTYPVVADAEGYEINRLQLTNTSLPGTTLTLGRQRIALDDQRFVGPVGWRQNEQTFDAFRVVNRSVANLVIDATYFNKVNRLFGEDSPQGDYDGDSTLLNVSYQTKIGKVTAFDYLLDFQNIVGVPAAVRDSTSTYGLRFAGDKAVGKVKLAYTVSYAKQGDYADNPLSFDLDYRFGELIATFKQFNLGYGVELMEGNGIKGFTTPLATLHKFNGWADKFLTTPANGLEDRYLTGGVTLKGVGMLDTLSLSAQFHDYGAERLDLDFGNELDISLAAKYKRVNVMLKFADFQQGVLASARDTQKVWGQVEFVW
ncbi:MAG TPA: alginate export family protein [Steroidobacteraceae bacterium]|nr:alginate export family protein [Steroidobacteraceae bacterium]